MASFCFLYHKYTLKDFESTMTPAMKKWLVWMPAQHLSNTEGWEPALSKTHMEMEISGKGPEHG